MSGQAMTSGPHPRLGRNYPPNLDHLTSLSLADRMDADGAPGPDPTTIKLYNVPVLYDQGQQPHCVGYSSAAATTSIEAPYYGPQTFDADAIYAWANANDGDTQPHDGSSVHAGMQYLLTQGARLLAGQASAPNEPSTILDKSVLWANDLDTVLRYLNTQSPIVFGIDWYEGMFHPDADGFVNPTGAVQGGHAILCRGFSMPGQFLVLRNSWGRWGVTVHPDGSTTPESNGDCKVHFADFVKIMGDSGEAAAIVDIPPTAPLVPTLPVSDTPPVSAPTPPAPHQAAYWGPDGNLVPAS